MSAKPRREAGAIALQWWQDLQRGDSPNESAKRKGLARMRAASDPGAVVMEPAARRLLERLPRSLEHAAITAGVLAHVREHTGTPMGRLVGRKTLDDAQSALVSEIRIRRLLKCADNGLMRSMRQIVGIAHGVGNIADLARSCLSWNDTSESEAHKQRWICGYYATSPATSRTDTGEGNAGAIALKWWATLRREAAAGESGKREALARMRNARSRLEILMEPETMRLIAKLWLAPQSVATAIAVIVHVTEHDSAPMGRIIGRTKRGDNESALVRENRFRQVIACTGEDVMQRMRNIVAISKGRANVAHLAESCMRWDTPKWGEREKRRWICDYYAAWPTAPINEEELEEGNPE